MKHRTALAVALVPLCAGLAFGASPTYAGTSTKSTSFALKASGYGTKVKGGQIPAGSSTTGYQVIGCTNKAGESRTNNVAEATVPGLGQASGIKTQLWTTSRNGVVASHHVAGDRVPRRVRVPHQGHDPPRRPGVHAAGRSGAGPPAADP
jgi:hypothetical protein